MSMIYSPGFWKYRSYSVQFNYQEVKEVHARQQPKEIPCEKAEQLASEQGYSPREAASACDKPGIIHIKHRSLLVG
jgi:hypothetical protein